MQTVQIKPGYRIKGFGLHNAGRWYTVLTVKDGKIQVEGPGFKHDQERFWDSPRWYVTEKGDFLEA